MKMMKRTMSAIIALALALTMSVGALATEDVGNEVAILRSETGEETAYTTLEAALNDAGSGSTVILTADYTISADITVADGVLLVVPYDSTYSTGLQDYVVKSTGTPGAAYVTLTVPSGCKVTVNGTMLVNGVAAGNSGMQEGVLDGNYGCVDMSGDLVVNGNLYARGIIDGTGAVTANSGANIYQMFQVRDWRGGTVSSQMATALTERVFPFGDYEVSNIRADVTYKYGSKLIGQGYVYAGGEANQNDATLLGTGGLFVLRGSSAYCVSSYDPSSSRLNVQTYGNVRISGLTVNAGGVPLVSSLYVCPLSKHMGVTAASGTLTVLYDTKLLPGSFISVEEGAALTVSKSLYVYGADSYLAGFTYGAGAATQDANLILNGTVSGNVYSSDGAMSNISGSAYATTASGTTATINEYIQNDGYHEVTFYQAQFTPVQ